MTFSYTAAEAYNASLNNYEAQLEKNRLELDSLIKRAIENGEFSVIYDRQTINNAYTNTTKTILNQLGYKVTEKVVSDEKKIWIISWEQPGVINDQESVG